MTGEPEEAPHGRPVFRTASWLDVAQITGYAIGAAERLRLWLRS